MTPQYGPRQGMSHCKPVSMGLSPVLSLPTQQTGLSRTEDAAKGRRYDHAESFRLMRDSNAG
jgi:hypothetical protein